MDLQLDGKVAIVTGATRGIGKAIANALSAEGAMVLGTGRSQESVDAARQAGGVGERTQFAVLDLLDVASIPRIVDQAVRQFGKLDIVVNNAASFEYRSTDEIKHQDWWDLTTQKLADSCDIIRSATPHLAASGEGAIVNVAGIAGVMPRGDAPHVGAVNAGIINMTQFFALKLAPQGIRVNAVSPGDTRTDRREARLQRAQEEHNISRETAEERLASALPLGRAVEPEEVAATTVVLCSPLLHSVTGSHILVDGGSYLGR